MGQSTGLLVWCLNTTPPSVHETGKGAVLASCCWYFSFGWGSHLLTELHCPEVCSTNILTFLELASLLALFQCLLWIGIFKQSTRNHITNHCFSKMAWCSVYSMVCCHMGCGLTMAGWNQFQTWTEMDARKGGSRNCSKRNVEETSTVYSRSER